MTGDRGSALLAAMIVSLLMVLLSLSAFSLASRDVAGGLSWGVAVRAELAARAGVEDVVADTGLGATSLPVGGTRVLPTVVIGGDSVTRSLERLGDSIFALVVTGQSRVGTNGPVGVRSARVILYPCDWVALGGGPGERLCPTDGSPVIRLLP